MGRREFSLAIAEFTRYDQWMLVTRGIWMIANWKRTLANIFAPAGKILVSGCRPQGCLSANAVYRAAQPLPGIGWSEPYEAIVDESTTYTPIIVLTACSSARDRKRAKPAGCDVFVPKPCLPNDLGREMRQLSLYAPMIQLDTSFDDTHGQVAECW